MKDLALFATDEWPLHPSMLRGVMVCPWKYVMRFLAEAEDGESGAAADTGSAMHCAARHMHRGEGTAGCLEAMRAEKSNFPAADLQEAAAMFLLYAADTRNRSAEVALCEEPIAFQISPAPEDKTQAPIKVIGTLDQVRHHNGQYFLYDIKTSKKDPLDLLNLHSLQIAGYCVGASIKLGKPVHPGALILPRKYEAKSPSTSRVFYHFAWSFKDTAQMLEGIRHQVAMIRNGYVWHVPNNDCGWCHQRTPDVCLPRLQELKLRWS